MKIEVGRKLSKNVLTSPSDIP